MEQDYGDNVDLRVGWLSKQGGFWKSWKTAKQARGTIPLDEVKTISKRQPISSSRQHLFELECPKRTYILQANSEFEVDAWITIIAEAVAARQSAATVSGDPRLSRVSDPPFGGGGSSRLGKDV